MQYCICSANLCIFNKRLIIEIKTMQNQNNTRLNYVLLLKLLYNTRHCVITKINITDAIKEERR